MGTSVPEQPRWAPDSSPAEQSLWRWACEQLPDDVLVLPQVMMTVTDKGDGFAIGVIDYGQEHNLIWVTMISATGEIWCAPNPKVRGQSNWTMGRARPKLEPAALHQMR